MKKIILLIIAITGMTNIADSQNPQWLNYTTGHYNLAITEEGNNMWIGTLGGLVEIDKTTGIPIFYNVANSNIPGNAVYSIAIDQNSI